MQKEIITMILITFKSHNTVPFKTHFSTTNKHRSIYISK